MSAMANDEMVGVWGRIIVDDKGGLGEEEKVCGDDDVVEGDFVTKLK